LIVSGDCRSFRNLRAAQRLERVRRDGFPGAVWRHAVDRPLIPPTLTRALESYWRHHPLRADRLARGLAALSGTPETWSWQAAKPDGTPVIFRTPPTPYRHAVWSRGPGHCCICGQPVFRYGWHRDLCGDGAPNRRARWHLACAAAWKFWNAPSEQVQILKRIQKHRCALTDRRLLGGGEVDHRVPLFRVWQDHRHAPWPLLLSYWGRPNLQVVNREMHSAKSSAEASQRRVARLPRPSIRAGSRLDANAVIHHLLAAPDA
jgi:hypothetical protein